MENKGVKGDKMGSVCRSSDAVSCRIKYVVGPFSDGAIFPPLRKWKWKFYQLHAVRWRSCSCVHG